MEVVIEYVFFENFIINYFIFSCCGALFKVKPKFWAVSCSFGAIMALFFPVFHLPLSVQIISTLLVASIMVCISFPVRRFKDFFFFGFGFIFLTFVFGGACQMISSWFGQLSLFLICIISFVLFVIVKTFLRLLGKRRVLQNFSCSVQITCKGNVVEEMGYFDSGNVLYDPLTSQPIVLISKEVFKKVVGQDYLYFLLKKEKAKTLPYGHYVNAGSIAGSGEMLVFMADKLSITEKGKLRTFEKQLLGVSLSDFSKTLSSGVLIHSALT